VDNGIYYHGGPFILAQNVAAILVHQDDLPAARQHDRPGSADGS